MLTKNCPGRNGLPVEPEGDLGEDDGHEARHVGLDHEVANLALQVEVTHHDCVLTWAGQEGHESMKKGVSEDVCGRM